MAQATFTCPRCFAEVPLRDGAKFCPRCGLSDAQTSAADTSPLQVTVGKRTYHVLDRVAIGSICNLYRCTFDHEGRQIESIFKIARDARTNDLVLNEADLLRQLHTADTDGKIGPFLPTVHDSLRYGETGSGAARQRHANVMRFHPEIRSPADELYSLAEVREAYPRGLDARDMAWIWRRLIAVIGFAHSCQVVHGAVLPPHVLVEPREHKLILIDWCCATHRPHRDGQPLNIINGGYVNWYKREGAARRAPTPSLDVSMAARCMIDLVGGNAESAQFPESFDPALQRYFSRCLGSSLDVKTDVPKLLADFDQLIEVLWGPRQFRPLTMPEKRSGKT